MTSKVVTRKFSFVVAGQVHSAALTLREDRLAPLCLLLGGSGPQDEEGTVGPNQFLRQLADGLASRGFSSLRFSKSPVGRVTQVPSNYEEEYVEVAKGVLSTSEFSGVPIVIIGHSLGGHVAPLIGREVRQLEAIVLVNSHRSSLIDVLQWQLDRKEAFIEPLIGDLKSALDDVRRGNISANRYSELFVYLSNSAKYDPVPHLAACNVPLMFIACAADGQVPVAELKLWEQAVRESCLVGEFRLFQGLNHLCMSTPSQWPGSIFTPGHVDAQVLESITAWVRSTT